MAARSRAGSGDCRIPLSSAEDTFCRRPSVQEKVTHIHMHRVRLNGKFPPK